MDETKGDFEFDFSYKSHFIVGKELIVQFHDNGDSESDQNSKNVMTLFMNSPIEVLDRRCLNLVVHFTPYPPLKFHIFLNTPNTNHQDQCTR